MQDPLSCGPEGTPESFTPQSAPRGLLFMYILHRLGTKPSHGYEILRDIEAKTGGAWRPRPGAMYPMLKKMVNAGYIECRDAGGETDHKVYSLTPKGRLLLERTKEKIRASGHRMDALRGIFLEMMGEHEALGFLVDTLKGHFEMIRAACALQSGGKPRVEVQYRLKEYSLLLEKELRWVNSMLSGIETGKDQSD
ncbi:MAG: PadR family transcriptional regulator [Candidatus Verstraetearchaeota archaeon]|nr:PadR family transcriptional regulator [Candidatus Verstraetearchaeota archaeon]